MQDGFEPLRGRQQADAVIVGAGLTGLMTADALTDAGLRVIVLESGQPGQGASGLCTGAATLLCAPVYEQVARCHGLSAARQHAEALRQALHELPGYLTPLAPFREAEAYVYAFLMRDLPTLHRHLKLLKHLGIPASDAPDAGGCPFPLERSLMLNGQLLTDVPGLIAALCERILQRGGRIFGQSRVITAGGGMAVTQKGSASAPYIVLAAGKPPGLRHNGVFALLESRSMLHCRLEGSCPLHTLQQSVRPDGLALTPVPGGIAASFCAGRSGARREQERIALFQRILRHRLADFQPGDIRIRQELWPLDGLPVIGALPDSGLLMATGYSRYGLLGAYLASKLLTRCILARMQPGDRLCAPDRLLPQTLLKERLRRLRRMHLESRLHPRRPACTLCRCHLRYCPEAEHWACPVCGSLYTMLGTLLAGPAVQSADISALQRPDL